MYMKKIIEERFFINMTFNKFYYLYMYIVRTIDGNQYCG